MKSLEERQKERAKRKAMGQKSIAEIKADEKKEAERIRKEMAAKQAAWEKQNK